jgi:hypothetical protein
MAFPFLIFAAAAAAQPTAASISTVPAAAQLFERDWVLMNWALKVYDKDRDILLEANEAEAAATEFRKIADGDGDGRISRGSGIHPRALLCKK